MTVSTLLLPLILVFAHVCHGNVDASFDILGEEGQPGWFEKILELGKKIELEEHENDNQSSDKSKNVSEKKEYYPDLEKRGKDGKFPSLAEAKLSTAFNKIGSEADGSKTALKKIKKKWKEISSDQKASIVTAFQTSAKLVGQFSNADKDPVGAVRAGIDIVSQFSALAGPKGQIISIALSFVSGFLSLFGVGSKSQQPDFSKIVRKEINAALNKYHDKVLSDEIAGTLHNFAISKAYVDSLSKSGTKLTEHQATSLKVNVPLWNGLKLLGKLEHIIRALLKENKRETVAKLLKYIELYSRLAFLKDMILLQSIALLPDQRNQRALLNAQFALRKKQKSLLEFLFNAKVNSKLAVRYFDPDTYPIADKYLSVILKVPNFDRSLAGKWCITQKSRGWYVQNYALGFHMRYRQLMQNRHPYVMSGGITCNWKLVPHGNNLYTIVVTAGCPYGPFCGQYMSHDLVGHRLRMTVERDADFWEITGKELKQIRSKWGCDTGNQWCNAQPSFQSERVKLPYRYVPERPIWVAYLSRYHHAGFSWQFTRRTRRWK